MYEYSYPLNEQSALTSGSVDMCQLVYVHLDTMYCSVFSLSPEELGKCAFKKADFSSQTGAKTVNRAPHRANPRVQEVLDNFVDDM